MIRHLALVAALVAAGAWSHRAGAALLLAVDVNDRSSTDSPDTQAGFSAYTMTGTTAASSAAETRVIGAYTVTLLAVDDGLDENTVTAGIQNTVGQIDDRDRATPTDSGAFTFGQLYDDIIFAGTSTGPTGGMNLTVSGGTLLPNTQYLVSIYDFDSGSTPAPQPRTANWLDGNNADAVVLATSFDGAVLPTSNTQYKFTGLARTDGAGALLLKGRNTTPNGANGATTIGVIINGLEIRDVPEPTSCALGGLAATWAAASTRRRRKA